MHLPTIKRALKMHTVSISIAAFAVFAITGSQVYRLVLAHPSDLSYGIALGSSLQSTSTQERARTLNKIRSLGFKEVRFNLDWSAIQPRNNSTYMWATSDAMVHSVQSSGLHAVVVLDRTPLWARPPGCVDSDFCAPARPNDFAKFAGAAVKRYHTNNVIAWEIWNEPNIVNFWKPSPNPEQYTRLLTAAYTAIKQQDSSATVLVGGMAGNATDMNKNYVDVRTFLSRMYTAGAKNSFSGIAYHPYTSLRLPDNNAPHNGWPKLDTTTPSIRSIMTANKDQGKDVWITEVGAPSSGTGAAVTDGNAKQLPNGADHVTLALQAQIAQAIIDDTKKLPWIKHLDWYTYTDNGTNGPSGSSYGIFQSDGKPKPAYLIFQKILQKKT